MVPRAPSRRVHPRLHEWCMAWWPLCWRLSV